MNAHVLHICSDYAKQKVYPQLIASLDALLVKQFVYVPVRTAAELNVNREDGLQRAEYRYAHILRPWHRLLFRTKIRRVVRDVREHLDPSRFSVTHAHFLYSDGAAALSLNRAYGLPYVVSVRNTDVNIFMRLRPDLRWLCREVIARARAIVFITPAYRTLLRAFAPEPFRADFDARVRVIPNGLSNFWLRDPPQRAAEQSDELRLLYVGDFSRNKNIGSTIRAAQQLNGRRPTRLTLVGSGGDGEAEIDGMLAAGAFGMVQRVGRVEDPTALRDIYRAHDIFVMPSLRETFGVAYLEALSQGLPVVYTRGQGVDGYFPEGPTARGVDSQDVASIVAAVDALAADLSAARSQCVQAAQAFAWPAIAGAYRDLYANAAGERAEASRR